MKIFQHRYRRAARPVLAAFAAGAAIAFIAYLLSSVAAERIEATVRTYIADRLSVALSSPGAAPPQISMGKIRYWPLLGEASMDSLAVYGAGNADTVRLAIASVAIRGLSPFDVLLRRHVRLSSLSLAGVSLHVQRADLGIVRQNGTPPSGLPSIPDIEKNLALKLRALLPTWLGTFSVDTVSVDVPVATYRRGSQADTLRSLLLAVSGLRAHSDSLFVRARVTVGGWAHSKPGTGMVHATDISFERTAATARATARTLRLLMPSANLRIDSLELDYRHRRALCGKAALYPHARGRTRPGTVTASRVELSELDFDALAGGDTLRAAALRCASLSASVLVDKRSAPAAPAARASAAAASVGLRSLPMYIHIDTVDVRGAHVRYTEQYASATPELLFSDLSLRITSLTSNPGVPLRLQARGYFMRHTPLRLSVTISGGSDPYRFSAHGMFGSMDAPVLNSFLLASDGVTVRPGSRLDTASFTIIGDAGNIRAELRLRHSNLRVDLSEKATGIAWSPLNTLISAGVNAFAVRNDGNTFGKPVVAAWRPTPGAAPSERLWIPLRTALLRSIRL